MFFSSFYSACSVFFIIRSVMRLLVDGERRKEKRKTRSRSTFFPLSRTFSSSAFTAAFAMAQANRNPAAHPWHDLPIQAEVKKEGRGGSWTEARRGRRDGKANREKDRAVFPSQPLNHHQKKKKKHFQDGPPCPQVITAVVEIGRGSKVKYELDKVRSQAEGCRRKAASGREKESSRHRELDCFVSQTFSPTPWLRFCPSLFSWREALEVATSVEKRTRCM